MHCLALGDQLKKVYSFYQGNNCTLALIGQEILQEFAEEENVGAVTALDYMTKGSFVEEVARN